jgi:hypothetical protein
MASSTTKVYYIIPDDGDDESHPNLFTIPLPTNSIKLRDIKRMFPLRQHQYHFRFKRSFQNKYVWLDLIDENSSVPQFENVIFCKISRLQELTGGNRPPLSQQQAAASSANTNNNASAPAFIDEADFEPQFESSTVPAAKTAVPASAKPNNNFSAVDASNELFEWTDMPAQPASSGASQATTPAPTSTTAGGDDLLDFLGSTDPNPSPPPTVGGMDFAWDATAFQSAPSAAPAVSSFGGIAPPRATTPGASAQQPPAKKPSESRLPTGFGAEAAKQFTL